MITLLKLGGSLITDKRQAHTAREDVIAQAAEEIRKVRENNSFPLILGHGSGSFGHFPAKKYHTREGVSTAEEWRGFLEVHNEALALNEIVMKILLAAGLPCVAFPPIGSITARDGRIRKWDCGPLLAAMNAGLIPVIFGDTVFDDEIGGTIVSTEDLFVRLCDELPESPNILLAGLEAGVWRDFPANTEIVKTIPVNDENSAYDFVKASEFTDVTGGMSEKVALMKSLVRAGKAGRVQIFSGRKGNLSLAFYGHNPGTEIIQ